jgi:hypothetical protein
MQRAAIPGDRRLKPFFWGAGFPGLKAGGFFSRAAAQHLHAEHEDGGLEW